MTESELKYVLSAADYARLARHFRSRVSATHRILNVYLDTPEFLLRRRGFGLRVRFVAGKRPEITFKGPARRGRAGPTALMLRLEIECLPPVAVARSLARGNARRSRELPPLAALSARLGDSVRDALEPVARMRMVRRRIRWTRGQVLELDRFTIGARVFHELELETTRPRAADAEVRALLGDLGIAVRPGRESKLARVFRLSQRSSSSGRRARRSMRGAPVRSS